MCDIITRKAKQMQKKMGKLKQKKEREKEREMMIDGDKKKTTIRKKEEGKQKRTGVGKTNQLY